jgi:hypothetical protein
MAPRRPLPEGHDCRRDDPRYPTISDWFADHRGMVPLHMAWQISVLMKRRNISFGEAYQALLDAGAIGLVSET